MGAIETIVDVVTDNRTYYNCPGCGRRVWAYGSFVGNLCWKCPGTLAHAAINSTALVDGGILTTAMDAVVDNKKEYRCPCCGVKKWAYGAGVGRKCWDCGGPLTWRLMGNQWFDMKRASEREVRLSDFLSYYNSSGTKVHINGLTFTNVISRSRLEAARGYDEYDETYVCGLHAINICLKMWGYDKQVKLCDYKHNSICGQKFGKSYQSFYEENIRPHFTYCSWEGQERALGQHLDTNWSYIDGTDYTNYSMIIMGGLDFSAHYTIIIGVDTTRRYYLVMDQSLKVWLVDMELLQMITVYKFSKHVGIYSQHSLYRVG